MPIDDDPIVIFLPEETEDHKSLLSSPPKRRLALPALLHGNQSWFTEAGTNCNAGAHFPSQDDPDAVRAVSCGTVRGIATMLLQQKPEVVAGEL